jgi:hypothetical protein
VQRNEKNSRPKKDGPADEGNVATPPESESVSGKFKDKIKKAARKKANSRSQPAPEILTMMPVSQMRFYKLFLLISAKCLLLVRLHKLRFVLLL